MSTKNNQKVIEIESIILNKEDIAVIDSIIGQLAYKVAKPIYDIIQVRMQEAASVIVQGQERAAKSLEAVKDLVPEKVTD